MNFWGVVLKCFGWKADITVPYRQKCIICVAPHTSNWDFPLGLFAYRSVGRKASFLMKSFWFFFPLKYLFSALGGIPVFKNKTGKDSLTKQLINKFNSVDTLNLAVTPEGTRSSRSDWHTGFLYIAYGAQLPVQLGVIDYKNHVVRITDEYHPVGNKETDMNNIKNYYSSMGQLARYPSKFSY